MFSRRLGRVPVDRIEVERAGVRRGEVEPQLELGGVVPGRRPALGSGRDSEARGRRSLGVAQRSGRPAPPSASPGAGRQGPVPVPFQAPGRSRRRRSCRPSSLDPGESTRTETGGGGAAVRGPAPPRNRPSITGVVAGHSSTVTGRCRRRHADREVHPGAGVVSWSDVDDLGRGAVSDGDVLPTGRCVPVDAHRGAGAGVRLGEVEPQPELGGVVPARRSVCAGLVNRASRSSSPIGPGSPARATGSRSVAQRGPWTHSSPHRVAVDAVGADQEPWTPGSYGGGGGAGGVPALPRNSPDRTALVPATRRP